MKISRHNFACYYIDYLDGKLSPSEQEELRAFLIVNSDLEEQTEDWNELKLPLSTVHYPYKDLLLKEEIHEYPDYPAIATLENLLTKKEIAHYSSDQNYRESVKIYRQLKLKPDSQLAYPGKSKLYKPALRSTRWYKFTAAAIFLLSASISYLFVSLQQDSGTPKTSKLIIPAPPGVHIEEIKVLPPEKTVAEIPKPHLKKERSPAARKIDVPLLTVSLVPLSLELERVSLQVELIREEKPMQISDEPEMYLAESAINWRASESRLLADPLLKTVVRAGTVIAEKIRKLDYAK